MMLLPPVMAPALTWPPAASSVIAPVPVPMVPTLSVPPLALAVPSIEPAFRITAPLVVVTFATVVLPLACTSTVPPVMRPVPTVPFVARTLMSLAVSAPVLTLATPSMRMLPACTAAVCTVAPLTRARPDTLMRPVLAAAPLADRAREPPAALAMLALPADAVALSALPDSAPMLRLPVVATAVTLPPATLAVVTPVPPVMMLLPPVMAPALIWPWLASSVIAPLPLTIRPRVRLPLSLPDTLPIWPARRVTVPLAAAVETSPSVTLRRAWTSAVPARIASAPPVRVSPAKMSRWARASTVPLETMPPSASRSRPAKRVTLLDVPIDTPAVPARAISPWVLPAAAVAARTAVTLMAPPSSRAAETLPLLASRVMAPLPLVMRPTPRSPLVAAATVPTWPDWMVTLPLAALVSISPIAVLPLACASTVPLPTMLLMASVPAVVRASMPALVRSPVATLLVPVRLIRPAPGAAPVVMALASTRLPVIVMVRCTAVVSPRTSTSVAAATVMSAPALRAVSVATSALPAITLPGPLIPAVSAIAPPLTALVPSRIVPPASSLTRLAPVLRSDVVGADRILPVETPTRISVPADRLMPVAACTTRTSNRLLLRIWMLPAENSTLRASTLAAFSTRSPPPTMLPSVTEPPLMVQRDRPQNRFCAGVQTGRLASGMLTL